ncbi:MAG: thermonuclease family protein [Hyphomicrobiales bacterium]|nr:thermonuclease family protein [Hyphomicrobiales bacterium]MCP5374315.1 thermonuclease family protein [Hyphomicrobiales bacterium]
MKPAVIPAALLALVHLLAPAAAPAEEVSGRARVVDGDTLEIAGRRVHLRGVDAPEPAQECTSRKGKTYRCGLQSIRYLEGLVRHQELTCAGETGADGTLVAQCKISWLDLNSQVVLDGWALSDVPGGDPYRREEDAARARREGLWRGGQVDNPWDWRAARGAAGR